ncbi:hypothetical protein OIV83_001133 [Microbotryomycetes sp. JL201]|nr:hypothetical protein OIV83_001133 [Microbotryomycetes sp. JL201]
MSTVPFPTTPEQPPPTAKKSSRNDLFSLNWSPVTPHVASRSPTPSTSTERSALDTFVSSARGTQPQRMNWRAEEREKELQARLERQQLASNSNGPRLPPTPPSPSEPFHPQIWPNPSAGSLTPWPLIAPGQPHYSSSFGQATPITPISPEQRPHSSPPKPPFRARTSGSFSTTAGISDNPLLDSRRAPRLRLMPNRDYSLGEGRHATVYLASFRPPSSSANDNDSTSVGPPWKLCAAKRVFPDRESQVAGLGEAFILAKLATPTHALRAESLAARGSPHIVGLYGVRDERDGVESAVEDDRRSRQPSSELARTLGRPLASSSHSDLRASSSTNAADVMTAAKKTKWLQRRSLRRKSSFTPCQLSPPIGSPSVESAGDFFTSLQSTSSSAARESSKTSANSLMPAPTIVAPAVPTSPSQVEQQKTDDYPRLILLLEYCPFGHVLAFARAYPERMSKRRWLEWAKQLTAAIAWAHERNVLHADIKPQNVLIAPDMTIRLADFGMSMFIPSPESNLPLPSDPHGLGTPPYSPPEFVKPLPSPFGFAADVFSLGVTLNVLISGHEPYENMRTVERMLHVGRGGYWAWEERRRQVSEDAGLDTGGSLSRASSIRSTLSPNTGSGGHDKIGRSRAGSAASRVSLNPAQAVFDTRIASTNSIYGAGGLSPSRPASLRRTDSADSLRSNSSNRAHAATLAVSAVRLLATSPDEADDEDCTLSTTSGLEGGFSPFVPVPPPSPPLSEQQVPVCEPSEAKLNDEIMYVAPETYSDGTSVVYFMNGIDIVPYELRQLLMAMTSAQESQRPTAKQVLEALEKIESV